MNLIDKKVDLKVIITEPPRSGTSFITGCIHRMGFNVGSEKWLKQADIFNPYGYYECLPLLEISIRILNQLGGDFLDIPSLNPGWTENFLTEKGEICKIIKTGEIELYKGNRLLIVADLYNELFPNAKWIFINRDIEQLHISPGALSNSFSFQEWKEIINKRLSVWNSSKPASKAFKVDYQDFKTDCKKTILEIQSFLDIELTETQIENCMSFYKPRLK